MIPDKRKCACREGRIGASADKFGIFSRARRSGRAFVLLVICLVSACAAREILVPRSAAVPAGIDLSGAWRLRASDSADQRAINAAIRRASGMNDRAIFRPPDPQDERRRTTRQRSSGGLVHVFLQNGTNLKITQTAGGLFLSFDRAVVEEYRFGENREVRIGPVVADRVSGWEGQAYVAETLDQEGMKLTERFVLLNNHTLRRTIILRGKNKKEEVLLQTFDRIG